jgi:hypothetical protein
MATTTSGSVMSARICLRPPQGQAKTATLLTAEDVAEAVRAMLEAQKESAHRQDAFAARMETFGARLDMQAERQDQHAARQDAFAMRFDQAMERIDARFDRIDERLSAGSFSRGGAQPDPRCAPLPASRACGRG